MKILLIGDIVGQPGRSAVTKVLPDIIRGANIDLVIANAENLAHGRGATVETIKEMQQVGVDYFTGGDHIFWQKGFDEVIDKLPVLRPANYPDTVPGKGFAIITARNNKKVLVMNLMGRTFLNERINDPFSTANNILQTTTEYDVSIVDFHAEATSEKHAFAYYLDGRVDAVVGTHTHVPTSDTRILTEGTMYVTDIGMTGITDSVLGVRKDIIIDLYTSGLNRRFEWEEHGQLEFRSVLIDSDSRTIVRKDFIV